MSYLTMSVYIQTVSRARTISLTAAEPLQPQGDSSQPHPQGGQVEGGLGVGQSYHSAALALIRVTLPLLR